MSSELVLIDLDNVTFRLKERADFSWLSRFGSAFAVFDEQDSGNLCFGVRDGDRRCFVKFAGARPLEYDGTPATAIGRLRAAEAVYCDLRHPALVALTDTVDTGEGFALVFEWRDGECLHSHWDFASRPKYTHPDSPFVRFRSLPVAHRVKAFETILDFHCFVERSRYVAVDFYDGSIMYDFGTETAAICDVDFYRKAPTVNDMGRMWGSTRFMSPEEYVLGAQLDSQTNVYNMGATAFCLLGDDKDWAVSKWSAGIELYEVATRATSRDRAARFTSLAQMKAEWFGSKP